MTYTDKHIEVSTTIHIMYFFIKYMSVVKKLVARKDHFILQNICVWASPKRFHVGNSIMVMIIRKVVYLDAIN